MLKTLRGKEADSAFSFPLHFTGWGSYDRAGRKMEPGAATAKRPSGLQTQNKRSSRKLITFLQTDMQTTGQGQLPFHTACESEAPFSEFTGEKTHFHIKTEFQTDKANFSPFGVLQEDPLHVRAVPTWRDLLPTFHPVGENGQSLSFAAESCAPCSDSVSRGRNKNGGQKQRRRTGSSSWLIALSVQSLFHLVV